MPHPHTSEAHHTPLINTHPKLISQATSAYIRSSSLKSHQHTSEAHHTTLIITHPKLFSQVPQNSHQNSGYQSTSQSVNQSGQPSFSIIIIQNTPKINLNITQKHHTLSKTASIPNPLTTTPKKTHPTHIQRSADATPPPGTSQGNSAPAAIQRSADGPPPPVRPPHLTPPKNQNGQTASGTAARQKTQTLSMPRRNDRTRHDHAAAPLADCPFVPPSIHPSHPHKKRAPRPNTRELSQKRKTQISNYHQSLPVVTNHHPTRSRNF